jgi:mannose-6-phosphate isomerase-like protein (cupin superfamily)
MDVSSIPSKQGENFTCIDVGPIDGVDRYAFKHPTRQMEVDGKLFLKELLGLTSAEISVNKMPPGKGMPFLHKHRRNEEIYLFLSGRGEFQVDGDVFPVTAGSFVRVARAGERGWRNDSDEPLICIVMQAADGSLEGHTITDGLPARNQPAWTKSSTA